MKAVDLTPELVSKAFLVLENPEWYPDFSTQISRDSPEMLKGIPMRRQATVRDIANAVLFLVAPEASYITGTVLTVDGGWTAGFSRDW